jgi:hypothetical protein
MLRLICLAILLPVLVISSGACGKPEIPTAPSGSFPYWISSIYPTTGPSDVETPVVISGSNFRDGITVVVDGIAAKVTSLGPSYVNVVFPAHTIGSVDVVVTNGNAARTSASLGGAFKYYDLAAAALLVFTDPVSGFSTSEVHDAQDEIVKFNAVGDLLWSDGTRFPGYVFDGVNIEAKRLCSCQLQIRFGSRSGSRRAYLTTAFAHEGNPGTVLDLERYGNGLLWQFTQVPVSEPGPNTFSGVITEATPAGPVPLRGAGVFFMVGDGWRTAETDRDGRFEVPWLDNGFIEVVFRMDGYKSVTRQVSITGHTRVDVQLGR